MSMIYLIGMGPGGPEYLTMQAIAALRKLDVVFILEKEGRGKEALAETRRTILDTYCEPDTYRVVTAPSPGRPPAGDDYHDVVADWHRHKTALIAGLIRDTLRHGEVGGILVWGDPALYDSNIAILHRIRRDHLPALRFEVIPGITSAQLLTARHQVPLNEIGEDVLITTARRMQIGSCDGHSSAVVMLNSNAAFEQIEGEDLDIHWGAYLGTEHEVLVSGKLHEVRGRIASLVAELKQRQARFSTSTC